MKTRFLLGCLAAGLGLLPLKSVAEFEVSAGISIQAPDDFYQPLSANGMWVTVGSYGRCWRPAGVTLAWRPYCNGSWEWTDCGWYWVSDDPWAWACYHYGSWVQDPNDGWVWVPGVQWAPAWVYWRTGGDYIGWAPCGPNGGVADASVFVFVQNRHFHDHILPDNVVFNNTTIIRQTTVINNIQREQRQIGGHSQTVFVNNGPRVEVVSKATGHKFAPVSIQTAHAATVRKVPEKLKASGRGSEISNPAHPVQEQPKINPERNQELPNRVAPDLQPKPVLPKEPAAPLEHAVPPEHERIIPQMPPEQAVPNEHREVPHNNGAQPAPKPIVPPTAPPHPVRVIPPETPPDKGQDRQPDHPQDHP